MQMLVYLLKVSTLLTSTPLLSTSLHKGKLHLALAPNVCIGRKSWGAQSCSMGVILQDTVPFYPLPLCAQKPPKYPTEVKEREGVWDEVVAAVALKQRWQQWLWMMIKLFDCVIGSPRCNPALQRSEALNILSANTTDTTKDRVPSAELSQPETWNIPPYFSLAVRSSNKAGQNGGTVQELRVDEVSTTDVIWLINLI